MSKFIDEFSSDAKREFMKTAMFAMIISAFLSPSMTYAEETLKCASPENPPLMFRGEDGKARGIAVDMITKAMEGTKYRIEVEILPWARALAMVQESTKDCVFTIYKTPERERILDFSDKPVIDQPIALYAEKSSNIVFDGDLAKLKNRSFVVMNAFNYGHKFDEVKAGMRVSLATESFQTFMMVGKKHADLTISNIYLAGYELDNAAAGVAPDIVQLQPFVEVVPSYIAFTKGKHSDAKAAFDANIDKYRSGEIFVRILSKYNISQNTRESILKYYTKQP